MIIEDYVSFNIAKLLKEKGYCNATTILYNENGDIINYNVPLSNKGFSSTLGVFYEAPTIQMAIKWLRIKGYQIIIKHTDDNGYFANILTMDNAYPINKLFDGYNSYEEACEAAIKYCLENLI